MVLDVSVVWAATAPLVEKHSSIHAVSQRVHCVHNFLNTVEQVEADARTTELAARKVPRKKFGHLSMAFK